MPRSNSLPSLRAQIAKLEEKADTLKRQVVSRLQREIKAHGLTAEDLFGAAADGGVFVGNGRKSKTGATASKSASAGKREAKYGDGAGNVWGGMGKRPLWLKERLEAGANLEDFLLVRKANVTPVPKRAAKSATKTKEESAADAPNERAVKAPKTVTGKKPAAKAEGKPRTSRKAVTRTSGAAEKARAGGVATHGQ